MGGKIDSIGYKIDKSTGRLIPKASTKKATIVYFTGEKELTSSNAKDILKRIKNLKSVNGITNNRILFYVTTDSNLRKFAFELKDYLTKNSFFIDGVGDYGNSIRDIKMSADSGFLPHEKVITIIVGTSLKNGYE